MNTKRASVFWTITLAELALAVLALTSVSWVQAPGEAQESTLAAATVAPSTVR
jgi:hypothetical protein